MNRTLVSPGLLLDLLALLGQLEAQLDEIGAPHLAELRATLGPTVAALHRVDLEQRLNLSGAPERATRH